MLTSKNRAYLRGLANTMQAITQVGKGGVTPELCRALEDALEAHELIKIGVLENSGLSTREAADSVAQTVGADVVSVIGRKIVLFRVSSKEENRKISSQIKLK